MAAQPKIFLSYAWGKLDASGVSYYGVDNLASRVTLVGFLHTQARPLQIKAHRIAAALRAAGYAVWVDTEKMAERATGGSDLSDAMAMGISSASAIVVCYSEAYARSVNCKAELTFAAVTMKKRCFYVNVGEPGYTSTSYLNSPEPDHEALCWFPFIMQNPLWADCRTPEAAAAGVPQLLQSLASIGSVPFAALALPPPLPTADATSKESASDMREGFIRDQLASSVVSEVPHGAAIDWGKLSVDAFPPSRPQIRAAWHIYNGLKQLSKLAGATADLLQQVCVINAY